MSAREICVLGVDTSLRSTGIGVVSMAGSRLSAVECGTIKIPASAPHSECLKRIHCGIVEAIARVKPEAVAIEGAFFSKNAATAAVLGEARGAVITACALAGVPVFEYSPRRVKQAVAGSGGAEKAQVRKMVVSLLGLAAEPQEDAGDALAIAICHLHARTGVAELMPKPI